MTGFGVPAGASSPNQPETSYPDTPLSATVGTSGVPGQRFVVVTATARTLPDLMWAIDDGRLSKPIWICPPMRSMSIGPAPLYGTWTISTPAIIFSSSALMWGDPPGLVEPKFNLPGLARASLSSSPKFFAGRSGWTVMTFGVLPITVTGAKSLTGSYGVVETADTMPCELIVPSTSVYPSGADFATAC